MRDPKGKIIFDGNFVIRTLLDDLPQGHFLRCSVAADFVKRGMLPSYKIANCRTIISDKVDFVVYPTEWSPKQLFDAAQLTLQVQREANGAGFDLKDASAWNIVFDGLQPKFVDLMSFEPLTTTTWSAFGQFLRHFIFPLLVYREKSLFPSEIFQIWRDGVPQERISDLLGLSRFLTLYWPMMKSFKVSNTSSNDQVGCDDIEKVKMFRARMYESLSWMLKGVMPRSEKNRSIWRDYQENRLHYSDEETKFKFDKVGAWLQEIQPNFVLDLGGNSGEYSSLAISKGARALCWDGDIGAMSKLYDNFRGSAQLFSLLSPIDSFPGGYGWSGSEYPGLRSRLEGKFDTVLMLAVVHHLAIACSVKWDDIFGFIAQVAPRNVICELLDETDQRVIELCRQYGREQKDFTIELQKSAALRAGFSITDVARATAKSTRELVLMGRVA